MGMRDQADGFAERYHEVTPEQLADLVIENLHGQNLGQPRRPYDDADIRKAIIDVCNENGARLTEH